MRSPRRGGLYLHPGQARGDLWRFADGLWAWMGGPRTTTNMATKYPAGPGVPIAGSDTAVDSFGPTPYAWPGARAAHSCWFVRDSIFLFGGTDSAGYKNDVWSAHTHNTRADTQRQPQSQSQLHCVYVHLHMSACLFD